MGPQVLVEAVEAVTWGGLCVTDEPTRLDLGWRGGCRLTGPHSTPVAGVGAGGGLTPGRVPGEAAVLGP